MNRIGSRVNCTSEDTAEHIERIRLGQTDERIREIYDSLKDEPLVRWKDSIKRVVGLPLGAEAGAGGEGDKHE